MFTLKIETGNAAFGEEDCSLCAEELARTLREAAEKIENGGLHRGALFDLNGNKVGDWSYSSN